MPLIYAKDIYQQFFLKSVLYKKIIYFVPRESDVIIIMCRLVVWTVGVVLVKPVVLAVVFQTYNTHSITQHQ